MTFQIEPLAAAPFEGLFDLSDAELADRKAVRMTADAFPGFPCRVSLADAPVGSRMILINHAHLETGSPYAATHAVYVQQDAEPAQPAPDTVPEVLRRRQLSVRGFDQDQMMQEATIVEGATLAEALGELFSNPAIEFADIHFAQRGCFGARARRA